MSPDKCKEDHRKTCDKELKLFTLVNSNCIHIELCCEECDKRYVHDVYNLLEV